MKSKHKTGWYLLFVLPLLLVFTTVVLIPFSMGIGYSFFSWDGLPLNPKIFVGMDNYIRLFTDAQFHATAFRTILFMLVSVILINVMGLGFAAFVTARLKMKNLGRISIVFY